VLKTPQLGPLQWLLVQAFHIFETLQYRARMWDALKWNARLGSCGEGSRIWGKVWIAGAAQMHLGDNVHIGRGAHIRAEGGLKIGDNTHISRNLTLYTVNHRIDGDLIPYDKALDEKPVEIGRNVWIGINVCIAPGTQIGDGAIVGMGTVVSGVVPPMTIVGGQKWRELGRRDETHYLQRDAEGAYGGADGVRFSKGGSE